MPVSNLFDDLPRSDEEITDVLHAAPGVRLERIVSRGHASPDGFWYDQAEDEWVAVLQGAARIAFADGSPDAELRAGDHLLIPARRRHRVAWTLPGEETIWLALFHEP